MEQENESYGLPLEQYELTAADRRAQKQAEDWKVMVAEWVEDQIKKEPPRSPESSKAFLEAAGYKEQPDGTFAPEKRETPAGQLRWRVKLYCGHYTEQTVHPRDPQRSSLRSHLSAMRCPECFADPAVIVAYEWLGLTPEPTKRRSRNRTR